MDETIQSLLDTHAVFAVSWGQRVAERVDLRRPSDQALAKNIQRDFRHQLAELLTQAGQSEAAAQVMNHEPDWKQLFAEAKRR